MEELTNYLRDLNCKKDTFYLLGDINIDLPNVNDSTATTGTDLLNSLSCNSGLSLINIPSSTRVTNSSATIIDHSFTNDVNHSLHAGVIRSDLSDHFLIFCKVSNAKLLLTHKRNNQQSRLFRDKNLVAKILMRSRSNGLLAAPKKFQICISLLNAS